MVLDGKLCAACTEDIELEQEITQLEQGITQLEVEITEFETRMEKIHIRRRTLRTVMNENHDPLIHQFPPEIASHIFLLYSPPSARFDIDESPIYLGAVCQKWRQLAWATPELWTSLHVRCPRSGKYNYKYNRKLNDHLPRPRLVTEWLERSGSLPLTIRVDDYWGWAASNINEEVLHILAMHSARWHDMHFEVSARHLHCLSGSSEGNILRRLALCHFGYFDRPFEFSIFSMKSKPSPTDLTLNGIGLQYVDIAWNNLTVASVYNIGVDECLELIRRAPLLETLKLGLINPSSSVFPIPSTRVIHLHLHLLELWKIEEEILPRILDSLWLPSLEQWIQCNQTPVLIDNVISFVECLSSGLKIFKIGIHLHCYEIAWLLLYLPSLEFLELRTTHGDLPIDLFNKLCANTQYPPFLPHLQTLEFLCEFKFPWEFLPRIFALSCWKGLRVKVNIRNGNLYSDEEVVKLLLELVDKGFDLSIIENGETDLLQEYRKYMVFADE